MCWDASERRRESLVQSAGPGVTGGAAVLLLTVAASMACAHAARCQLPARLIVAQYCRSDAR